MWLRSLESFKFCQNYYIYSKKIVSNYFNSCFLIDLLGIFFFSKIFEVLSQLAKSYSNFGVYGSTNIHTGKGIFYEIGSVIVSVNLSQTCPTLDGIWNPVSHPLWRRLLLWNKSIDNHTWLNQVSDSFFMFHQFFSWYLRFFFRQLYLMWLAYTLGFDSTYI